MNIRTNQPIQFRIEVVHENRNHELVTQTFNYGFPSEPSALKVKITARAFEEGIRRTIPGLTFVSYNAERIER